jgi:transposase-like protein
MLTRVAPQKSKCKSGSVSKGKRHRQQQVLEEKIKEQLVSFVRLTIQVALKQEIEEILGRNRYERSKSDDWTRVSIACNNCGNHLRRQFRRAGFYQRTLLADAWLVQLDIPRLRCCQCGGMVSIEFAVLAPYNRLWGSLEGRIRQLAGLCLSLRDSIEVLAGPSGIPLSVTTLSRRINAVAELAEAMRRQPIVEVPAVVMLDGIWVKALEATDKWKTDKVGRRRKVKRRERFPLLVAYGVDPDTGRKWVLDWEKGKEEDGESWSKLLRRLFERGLCYKNGLRLFVHDGSEGLEAALKALRLDFGVEVKRQRDVFHKLRNVAAAVVGEEGMSSKERSERRKEVVKDAAEVYDSLEREEIYRHLDSFKTKWKGREPEAVATLERDFELTLNYLTVMAEARQEGKDWPAIYLRATGALERAMRSFRQKTRQVLIFHSDRGREAAIYLVVAHRWPPNDYPWYQTVEQALLIPLPRKERIL